MVKPIQPEKEHPYYFCIGCSKLSPVTIINGIRVCRKCSYPFEDNEGGRVVMLTRTEAKLRCLTFVKKTGELGTDYLEDED